MIASYRLIPVFRCDREEWNADVLYKTTVRVAGVEKVIPDGQPDPRLYSISQTGWYGVAALLPQCLS